MPYTPDLARAFMPGLTFKNSFDGEYHLEIKELADVVLTSGKIVACDPFTLFGADKAFERSVPPGRYPVIVTLTKYETGSTRTAFARLQFQSGQPVRWEMALKPGQNLAGLADDEFYGYGVDTGTGCFMDADAVPLLEGNEAFIELMHAEMSKDYPHETWDGGAFTVNAGTGLNLVSFFSGWGDGSYPSFWGFDAEDRLLCLMTDFCILPDEGDEEG
jgi:hypothetical protein